MSSLLNARCFMHAAAFLVSDIDRQTATGWQQKPLREDRISCVGFDDTCLKNIKRGNS
jgi:hypothetical protein